MDQNEKNTVGLLWNRRYLALCCVLEALYGTLSMCFAVVLNLVASTASTAKTMDELFAVGAFTLLFGVVYPACRAAADSAMYAYAEHACEAVRGRINRAIFSMDSAGFARRDTGEYLNTLTSDVLLLRDQYYSQIPQLFSFAAQFVFCVVYSVWLNPVVGIVLMVMSAVQYVVPVALGKNLNRYTAAQSQASAVFTSKAKELLLGFAVVKSYGGEAVTQKEFDAVNREMTARYTKTDVMTQILCCTNLLIALLMTNLSVLVAGYFVVKGQMAPATLLTVFYIANRYSMPAMDFAGAYTKIKASRGIREKIAAFLADHPEITPAAGRPIRQGVEVRHLNYAYAEGAPALRDISFRFEAGKKYLIVGESGCGKSTLLKVLAGQYPAAGVLVDGQPMEALPAGQLAGRLVLVGQQPYVFRRTVAENIDFLNTGDRARLEQSVEQCCLGEFAAALPQGVDTPVDEEQRQLSGGQKARIGLARALYTGPDVLLLDEVTSALDPDTAHKIEEMVLNLPGVLVIHISHKPAPELTARYDAVLYMENGRLARVQAKQKAPCTAK